MQKIPPFLRKTPNWQTDRQTDRQTDGQTDRQTNRQEWFYSTLRGTGVQYKCSIQCEVKHPWLLNTLKTPKLHPYSALTPPSISEHCDNIQKARKLLDLQLCILNLFWNALTWCSAFLFFIQWIFQWIST